MSGLDDSNVDGEQVELLVSRGMSELIHGVLLLDDACELLVAGAEGRSDGVLFVPWGSIRPSWTGSRAKWWRWCRRERRAVRFSG